MSKYLVVCDLSWMMYRSYFTYKPDRFFYKEGDIVKPNGHIYGVLRSIISLKNKFKDVDIILCKDGVPKDRIELMGGSVTEQEDGSLKVDHGAYKADRNGTGGYNIHHDSTLICNIASLLPGVSYAYERFKESDDLMYALAKSNKDKYEKVFVYSGDNDLLQTIDDNIFLIRSMAKDAIILDDYWVQMESDYKVPAKCLPIFRALRGDTSDTIEAVYPRLSKDFARYVATHFNSIEDIEWYQPDPKEEWYNWWLRILTPRSLKLLERNYKLMKLNVFPVGVKQSKYSIEEAYDLVSHMGMKSFLKYYGG